MNPVDLLRQPWFAVSPSPISFLFYAVLAYFGAKKLLNNGAIYKRGPKLMAYVSALLILGILIFIQDTQWLICNTFRWIIPLYCNIATFQNYYVRYPQNILGIILLYMCSYGEFHAHIVTVKKTTLFWMGSAFIFQTLIFMLAPFAKLDFMDVGCGEWQFRFHCGFRI